MNIFVGLFACSVAVNSFADSRKPEIVSRKLNLPHSICADFLEVREIPESAVTPASDPSKNPTAQTEHGRFAFFHVNQNSFYSQYLIRDLMTGKELRIETHTRVQLHISPDGTKLLETSETGSFGTSMHGFDSTVVDIPNWSSSEPLQLTKMLGTPLLGGSVIAYSPNFDRLIVDKNHGHSATPNISIVEVARNKIVARRLPGWKEALQDLTRTSGVRGQITPDGEHLAITLTFESLTISHDWIGLWDLRSSNRPMVFSSASLDSPLDQEGRHSSRRRFISRILPDGQVLVARLISRPADFNRADVQFKFATFQIGQKPKTVFSHRVSVVNADALTRFEFDETGDKFTWRMVGNEGASIDLVRAGIIKSASIKNEN